jgi:hypothetical protein
MLGILVGILGVVGCGGGGGGGGGGPGRLSKATEAELQAVVDAEMARAYPRTPLNGAGIPGRAGEDYAEAALLMESPAAKATDDVREEADAFLEGCATCGAAPRSAPSSPRSTAPSPTTWRGGRRRRREVSFSRWSRLASRAAWRRSPT